MNKLIYKIVMITFIAAFLASHLTFLALAEEENHGFNFWRNKADKSGDKKNLLMEMLLEAVLEKEDDGLAQKLLIQEGPDIFYPATLQKEEYFQKLILLTISFYTVDDLRKCFQLSDGDSDKKIMDIYRIVLDLRATDKNFTAKLKDKFLEIQKWDWSQESKDTIGSYIKTIELNFNEEDPDKEVQKTIQPQLYDIEKHFIITELNPDKDFFKGFYLWMLLKRPDLSDPISLGIGCVVTEEYKTIEFSYHFTDLKTNNIADQMGTKEALSFETPEKAKNFFKEAYKVAEPNPRNIDKKNWVIRGKNNSVIKGPDGKKMIYIPSGSYEYIHGISKMIEKDIIRSNFLIDQTEVSNQEYVTFLNAALEQKRKKIPDFTFHTGGEKSLTYIDIGPRTVSDIHFDGNRYSVSNALKDHPITGVTWYGANAYATYYGKSLPAWDEWRAAAQGPSLQDFSWGNNWDPTKPNWTGGEKAPVDSHEEDASCFGVLNMIGNVSEWTAIYEYDSSSPTAFVAGGACFYGEMDPKIFRIHTTFRSISLSRANIDLGFRCVLKYWKRKES